MTLFEFLNSPIATMLGVFFGLIIYLKMVM